MIDETVLESELARLADALEVSAARRHELLELAEAPGGRLATVTRPGRARTRLVAAAASLVLVAGTALVTWGTAVGPSLSTADRGTSGGALPQAGTFSPGASFYLPTPSGVKLDIAAPPPVTGSHGAGQSSVTPTSTRMVAGSVTVGPRIESTGSENLRVARGGVGPALTRLAALATRDGGTVSSLHETAAARRGGRATSGQIVLSVPQARFTALVGQVQSLGRATSVRTTSTDVTSQYVDLRARIGALEVSRRQYLAIMAKATTINGILAVQGQIDSLQTQIEQFQGELNLLDHETAFGSLAVSVSAPTPPPPAPHHRSGVARAWDGSVGGFVRAGEGLIRVSGPALFVVLCLGALGLLGRGLWRYAVRRRL